MTYQWRKGSRTGGVDPTIAGAELERIWEEHDERLEPPVVVEESRPKAAPLHPVFEWNDKKAAEEWRNNQARQLIRNIRIVNPENAETDEPAYVHIRQVDAEAPYYQSSRVAVENPDEWSLAVEGVSGKFRAAGRALHDLEGMASEQQKDSAVSLITAATMALSTAQQAIEKINA